MDEERDAVLVGFSPSVWVVADIPGATSRTERRGTEGLATTGFQDHASTGWDGGAASTDPFCQASWLTVCRA
uniref:Uncharacterized protein n=1 Tax=Oryza rufipogon TaxID=4529 RepID=A0A0E0QZG8_ORYRU